MRPELSTKQAVGLAAAGLVALLAAGWFLAVSPQRSTATELDAEVAAVRGEIVQRRAELAQPKAALRIRTSDLYRLTKALPDDTDMAGIILDLDRLARTNGVDFASITPSGAMAQAGYTVQPMQLVLQGRFGSVNRFLRDVRTLVDVRRGGDFDARGRLFSIDRVAFSQPGGELTFPNVRAEVTINAFVNAPAPAPAAGPTETPPPSSTPSSGTVAAEVTP